MLPTPESRGPDDAGELLGGDRGHAPHARGRHPIDCGVTGVKGLVISGTADQLRERNLLTESIRGRRRGDEREFAFQEDGVWGPALGGG
jgi:hypothetical protein